MNKIDFFITKLKKQSTKNARSLVGGEPDPYGPMRSLLAIHRKEGYTHSKEYSTINRDLYIAIYKKKSFFF